MKYMVLESHDERNNFNFKFETTDHISEWFNDNYIDINTFQKKELGDGVLKFEIIGRDSLDGQTETVDKETLSLIECIFFHIVYFIPVDKMNKNMYIEDAFINKNLKFGILDLKD